MTPYPRFSVILISFNQRGTARDAAQSALDSLGDRGELVCVDDGSTDGTGTILDELAARHPNMRVRHHPHAGRPAIVRNAGLAMARGSWISFLDGDDLYDARRFEMIGAAIDEGGSALELIFHNHRVFVDDEPPLDGVPRITPPLEHELAVSVCSQEHAGVPAACWSLDGDRLAVFLLAHRFVMQTSSFCVRRELLATRGITFDENRVFGEDNPFMLACALGSRVAYLRENLTCYRKHHGSLTASLDVAGHREQLRSLHEQVTLIQRKASDAVDQPARIAMRAMLYEATLHHGYLLERRGDADAAVTLYLRAAAEFKRVWPAFLAAKALIRNPKPITQPLRVADSLTK